MEIKKIIEDVDLDLIEKILLEEPCDEAAWEHRIRQCEWSLAQLRRATKRLDQHHG